MKEILLEGLEKYNIKISNSIAEKLLIYKDMLLEKNKIVNLTAITEEKSVIEKHFIDSLLIVKFLKYNFGKAIDIGTGAGFPGMVLAIANEDIEFYLVDSIGKKTKFLSEVKERLGLKNIVVVNKRAEDFIKENKRELFDFAFSRGVSEMRVILEYALPFLKVGGIFYAQKVNYELEIKNADNALKILKGKISKIHELKLPYSEEKRVIIEVLKKDVCSENYPRKSGTAEKKPL